MTNTKRPLHVDVSCSGLSLAVRLFGSLDAGYGIVLILNGLFQHVIGGIGVWAAVFHVVCHTLVKSSLFLQMAVVRRIYNGYRINRIGDYIRINPTGAVGLLVGMAVLLAFPPSPFFVSEVMLFRETIAGGRWWVAGTVLLLLCIVIYSVCYRIVKLCYQPNQDSLHPAPARNALSWAAFSLLAAAMVVGIWQPALLQQLIDQIVSL